MNRIAITTESVCDLPEKVLKERQIDFISFDIVTDKGVFRDYEEISARNILDYMAGGEKHAQSQAPTANQYKSFFEKKLKEYDEVIHICVSSKISRAVENASLARAKMGMDGQKIHVIDSLQMSAGMGVLVLNAAKMAEDESTAEEIKAFLKEKRTTISTSLIANNADYLYFNGKVSDRIMKMCRRLKVHPVLHMKNGVMKLKSVQVGSYEKACIRYIQKELRHPENIETEVGFLVYAGCSPEVTNRMKQTIENKVKFQNLLVQHASAAISCNSGPGALGVLFVRREEEQW